MAVNPGSGQSRTGLLDMLSNVPRVGGVAGILFIVIFVAGVVAQGDTPMIDDSAAEIREYFDSDSNLFLVTDWMIGAAFILFLLPFASALRTVLGNDDPATQMWARLSFAGALVLVAAGAAASLGAGGLAIMPLDDLDDSTVLFASRISAYGFGSLVGFGIAAFVLPSSILIASSGVLWRWLGYAGLVVGLANVIGALGVLEGDDFGPITVLGIIGFLAFALWVLVTSIGLLRSSMRTP